LACGAEVGLPAVIRSVLVHSHDSDPSVAVIEDINVGGNANARSIAIATILFAAKGTLEGTQAETWWNALHHKSEIVSSLDKIQGNQ